MKGHTWTTNTVTFSHDFAEFFHELLYNLVCEKHKYLTMPLSLYVRLIVFFLLIMQLRGVTYATLLYPLGVCSTGKYHEITQVARLMPFLMS
ncbi:hypothetical protein BDV35DRAFT_91336 [Aspergillus flavus]|uniref:Uncharacterized protein n=1 Tax=Aspergillus flavus TaxID=5059 RepID=A0A5N6GHY2_ASPFL|nr:hypothetical protein BDV35DRAFT_91336 [Aspergillus flavus]